jgi:hypothetical protein
VLFFKSINFDRWRRLVDLSRQGIIYNGEEQADIEHGVNSHKSGQV